MYITNSRATTKKTKKRSIADMLRKEEIKKYIETNDNENMTIQNLCDAAKAVLIGKFIAMKSYLKKQEKSNKQSNLTSKGTRERRTSKTQS